MGTDKVVADIRFPDQDLERRMYTVAEHIASTLDHKHGCNDACPHIPTLHIRINDTKTGKGTDHFYHNLS